MGYVSEATDAPRPSTISTAIEDFDSALERAAQYAERLQKLCDRIHGPQPQEVSKGTVDAPPHSLINSIQQRRSRFGAILDRMDRSIGGLENGI